MFERGNHEIILLVIVNPILSAHQAQQIKTDTIGAGIVEAENALTIAGYDTRAVNTQPRWFLDQTKLDRIPVQPRKLMQCAKAKAAQSALPISDHIIGENRVREHRDMAENIVEHIGFLKVIELFGRADKIACRKTPICEVIEKHIVGNKPRHRDDLPTRC